jgi:hypothetical protein
VKFQVLIAAAILSLSSTLATAQNNQYLLKAEGNTGANSEANLALAKAAAAKWLESTDSGDHAAGWQQSAALFRSALPQASWEASAAQVRGPLGAVGNRKFKAANFSTQLPGAPEGQYYVLVYTTQFEKKDRASEAVITMREDDGSWKVAGYQVR